MIENPIMIGYFHLKWTKVHLNKAEIKTPINNNTTPSFNTPDPQHKSEGKKKIDPANKYEYSFKNL